MVPNMAISSNSVFSQDHACEDPQTITRLVIDVSTPGGVCSADCGPSFEISTSMPPPYLSERDGAAAAATN